MTDQEADAILSEREWSKFSDARDLIQEVWYMGLKAGRAEQKPAAPVNQDAVLRQAREALADALRHHGTTSLPLQIREFGSAEACGEFGRKTWIESVPNAIAAIDAAQSSATAQPKDQKP